MVKENPMKHSCQIILFVAVLALGRCAAAAQSETLEKLDAALKAVSTFEHGGNAGPLVEIEQIVFRLPADSDVREQIEEKLLQTLESAATSDAKRFLCGQLRVIGTAKCIPHLEKLLTDKDVSHMARYALGRLEVPAASAALRRALSKTSGKLQAGIIDTLANRGDSQAKPDFVRLLASSDETVAKAAAIGLGRLGGEDSVKALKAARTKATDELGIEIDNALLNCAGDLAAEGKTAEAASIYEPSYRSAKTEQLQFAGLRGLMIARGEKAVDLLVKAIQDDDTNLSRFAISLVGLVKGERATNAFTDTLTALPAEGQVLMLRALGSRGDTSAAEAITASTKSQDQAVRMAALEALGQVGGPSSVSALIEGAVAAEGLERAVARASLLLLKGDAIDRKLIQSVHDGSAKVRVEVIHALALRKVTSAMSELFQAARDEDVSVRSEAIRTLGVLATKDDLSTLVKLAVEPKASGDRPGLEEAIGKAFLRVEDKARSTRIVVDALEQAPAEAKPTLVRLLSRSASPEALQRVQTALKNSEAPVQDAAVQSLSEWPDTTATESLVELIATAKSQEHKEQALRGYVRLAGMSPDPTAMYVRVLNRVERVNDKKLVLAGLGLNSDSPQALELALKHLDDEHLQATAGLAALRIAHKLRDRDEKLARTALQKVLDVVDHEDVRKRAQEVLNDISKYEDHILTWVGVGPFTEKGKEGSAVYRTVFEPEKLAAEGLEWKPITKGIGKWEINLEATFGGLDCCAAYLRTRVWSGIEQEAQLETGSDDAIKAWLNGELVLDEWQESSVAPRQKRVRVKLVRGWNVLMIKAVDQRGGWVAACRLRKPDGNALEGLKFEAQ